MHDLGRRPDRHRVGSRVVEGGNTAALDRHRRVAVMIKAALQSVRRERQRRAGIALGNRERAEKIGLQLVVNDRRTRGERHFGADDRGQRVQFHLGQRGGVFRRIAAFRHDHGNRFADMPHLIVRQQRLLRIVELVLDEGCPFARQRELRIRHRRQ